MAEEVMLDGGPVDGVMWSVAEGTNLVVVRGLVGLQSARYEEMPPPGFKSEGPAEIEDVFTIDYAYVRDPKREHHFAYAGERAK